MYRLNTYDYGARQYDPARITWDRMDPLCEKYYHINPYVYCGGNPINRIDPDGMKDYAINDNGDFYEKKGLWQWFINLFKEKKDRVYQEGSDKPLATFQENSINLKCGSTESKEEVVIEIKDSKDADKLRDVVMENSDVEWCRVEAKDGTKTTNILYTEHDKKEVSISNAIEQLTSKQSKNITKIEHNHPNPNSDNSLVRAYISSNDYDWAAKYPNAKHIVYDQQTRIKKYYNGKGIYKKTPWK